jgi:hypothetical protein
VLYKEIVVALGFCYVETYFQTGMTSMVGYVGEAVGVEARCSRLLSRLSLHSLETISHQYIPATDVYLVL